MPMYDASRLCFCVPCHDREGPEKHVAEWTMDIEESGLKEVKTCKDVPDWARLTNVVASFDPTEKNALSSAASNVIRISLANIMMTKRAR